MSDSLYVWCQLYFRGEDGQCRKDDGDAFKIKPEENDSDVADLKGRAYVKKDTKLGHCNADDLLVYRPGTEFNDTTKLRAGMKIAEIPPTSDIHPLMVVAPAPPQRPTKPVASSGLNGNWQTDRDLPHRREMIQHIVKMLKKDKTRSPEWLSQLPRMAKHLEVSLYRNARSFDAYMDMNTLKDRLQRIAVELSIRIRKQQNIHIVYD